ncbi:putative HTH-type transcriptional regulator YczG [Streptomyces inusitatus]|uniref:HTH-type transcriptional regulator YczG n=1 Tax=Streptomyces inusitatus TaxID=68221 RepID=A0A918UX28_9ACTN|nr:helix-turn-helix domain-containing protein [Streptomyces inusitatus]GGZ39309.1 putative HTH-type transcriptional regulator YczG [Streptomyces inusitatus]
MRPLPELAPETLTLASVLYALGDPLRLELVRRVAADPGMTCAPGGLKVPKSTLTNHWRILREAGVIRMAADGRFRRIWLRAEELENRFPGLLDTVLRLSADEPMGAAVP